MAGRQGAHEVARGPVRFLARHDDVADVAGIEIADRTLDQAGFLVDQRRRGGFQRHFADLVPQPQQIFEVAPDLRLGALHAGGAHDHRHAVRRVEIVDDRLQALAVVDAGDAARDAAAAIGVRHQHAIAAGQRQIGGEGGALVAALFLGHLHQQDLPALDDFLDLVAAQVALPAAARLLLVDFGIVLLRRLFAADHVDDFGAWSAPRPVRLRPGRAVRHRHCRLRSCLRPAGHRPRARPAPRCHGRGVDAAGRGGGSGGCDLIDRRAAQFEARRFERGAAGAAPRAAPRARPVRRPQRGGRAEELFSG